MIHSWPVIRLQALIHSSEVILSRVGDSFKDIDTLPGYDSFSNYGTFWLHDSFGVLGTFKTVDSFRPILYC